MAATPTATRPHCSRPATDRRTTRRGTTARAGATEAGARILSVSASGRATVGAVRPRPGERSSTKYTIASSRHARVSK